MPKKIVIPAMDDLWNSETNEFISIKEQTLIIEHSLVSISKWEQKWKKPFLTDEDKTGEELLDYVKCMTINKVNELVYSVLPISVMQEINEYIGDPMTATTFNQRGNMKPSREIITSELIYYNMIMYGIPVEFEKWHLNRLITLIRIFAIKSEGNKKMSRAEAAAYQRSINESRLRGHRR